MASSDLMSARGERGDIVMGWLVKIVVLLSLLGIVAFDAISIVTTRLAIEDQGNDAARSASETWARTHDAQTSFASATSTAIEANALNTIDPASFRVDADGTAHLIISRTASTIVAKHIGPLRKLCAVDAASQGRSTT